MDNKEKLYDETLELSERLLSYQKAYYVDAKPLVSDGEYDRLFDRLKLIEDTYPSLRFPSSPTLRVGSDLSSDFPEVVHTIPVLSLDKAYDTTLIHSWMEKCQSKEENSLSFVLEQKIDGISIVLYYEKGILIRAVTRGNGAVGNDVTNNVRTISSIPLKLSKNVDIAVRGEIYLPKKEFEKINESLEDNFANPRNLCAGSIRRKKSSETAKIPLNIFVYEGFWSDGTPFEDHLQILSELKVLGFRLNPSLGIFCNSKEEAKRKLNSVGLDGIAGSFSDLEKNVKILTEKRSTLSYEIDGLVLKVNEIKVRNKLGYTVHHPRWALAYKFESPQAESIIKSIDIQIGRTGRVTPVARIKPVEIGGSTVSNVTLHNQVYIDELELSIGDSVEVSKRGDVIPAVERVVEKNESGNTTFTLPSSCPSCGTSLVVRGAHSFCSNIYCPKQVLGRLKFFAAKAQMDIESLGPKTLEFLVEKGLIKDVQDLYSVDLSLLVGEPGFGEKKIKAISDGLEESKKAPFSRVLASLGLPEVGKKVVEMIINSGLNSMDKIYEVVDRDDVELLSSIPLVGEKTSKNIINSLSDAKMKERIDELRKSGLSMEAKIEEKESLPKIFENEVWCATGSFENFNPRGKALDEIEKRGGRVVTSLTGKTTHLLCGKGGGGKKEKAIKKGITIIDEIQFLEILNNKEKEIDSKKLEEKPKNLKENSKKIKKVEKVDEKAAEFKQGELF